jgi:SAM-dependent methyltransferase
MKPIDSAAMYSDGRHYDAQYRNYIEDIPFYLRQAERYGDPVLELACGTGRIAVPLAQQGFQVTGLDISEPMLSQARQKAATLGVSVDWIQADMRSFSLSRRFALIFIAFNSISHLHDRESLEAFFSCIRAHLAEDGRFVVGVFNPRLDLLLREPWRRYPFAEYPDPDGRGIVTITENNLYDKASQVNHISCYYQIDQECLPSVIENNMRIFYPQELDDLLYYNGFSLEAKYGDFGEGAFRSASPHQLAVCRLR